VVLQYGHIDGGAVVADNISDILLPRMVKVLGAMYFCFSPPWTSAFACLGGWMVFDCAITYWIKDAVLHPRTCDVCFATSRDDRYCGYVVVDLNSITPTVERRCVDM
jgi:hypothetical protein